MQNQTEKSKDTVSSCKEWQLQFLLPADHIKVKLFFSSTAILALIDKSRSNWYKLGALLRFVTRRNFQIFIKNDTLRRNGNSMQMVWSSECLLINTPELSKTLSHINTWSNNNLHPVASLSQRDWQGWGTGSSEQGDKLTTSWLQPQIEGNGQHWRSCSGSAELLGAKFKPPFQTAVILSRPVPYTKATRNRRKAIRTLPRASSQRSLGESCAPFKSGR